MTKKTTLIIAALVSFGVAACAGSATSTPKEPNATNKQVSFTVKASQSAFLPGSEVTVTIMNAEQMALQKAQAGCTVSKSSDGTEATTCPDGKVPKPVKREVFKFPYSALSAPIQIKSETVVVGQAYSISIGGKAADNCNSSGGSAKGTAATAETVVEPEIATTSMACEKTP